jgi:hypothetical protein
MTRAETERKRALRRHAVAIAKLRGWEGNVRGIATFDARRRNVRPAGRHHENEPNIPVDAMLRARSERGWFPRGAWE